MMEKDQLQQMVPHFGPQAKLLKKHSQILEALVCDPQLVTRYTIVMYLFYAQAVHRGTPTAANGTSTPATNCTISVSTGLLN